jgi:nitroreductase
MNNNFKHLAAERYSCRHYSQEPIDKQQILDILECARLAPSACNRQPWKFIVVTDSNELSAVCESYDRNWIKEAPAAIIVLGNRNEAWHRQYGNYDATDIDIAITTEHICLAATDMGLGTCWVCNFEPTTLRNALNIPEEWEPLVIIPVGKPAKGHTAPEKKRKDIEELVQWGKF